jgi:hypothetical protein
MKLARVKLKGTLENSTVVEGSSMDDFVSLDALQRSMHILFAKGTSHFVKLTNLPSKKYKI